MSTERPPGRNHWLDLMHGLAALLVCAGHLRAATMVDLAHIDNPSVASKALYVLTGLGHQSVMVFFVLSGYLVGGSLINAGRHFNWRSYAQARLSRLWTVLLPCLALTWGVDQVILSTAPQVLRGDYAPLWHSAPQAGQYDASWLTLLGNVFFVQTLAVPVFGSNGPLWSLANEFWYYVLFPMTALVAAGKHTGASAWQRLASTAALIAATMILPSELLSGYLIWLMGVAAFLVHQRHALPSTDPVKIVTTAHWATWSLVLIAGLVFSKWSATKPWTMPWGDWVLGAAVSTFIVWVIAPSSSRTWPRWLQAAIAHSSDLSFSLYLSHFPLVMLIGVGLSLEQRMQPAMGSWMLFLAMLAALLMVGHLMWWLFERHTSTVRRLMSASLQRSIRTTSTS